jgi:hypothetical protein
VFGKFTPEGFPLLFTSSAVVTKYFIWNEEAVDCGLFIAVYQHWLGAIMAKPPVIYSKIRMDKAEFSMRSYLSFSC